MATPWRRSIHSQRNSFLDRAKTNRESFSKFLPVLEKLDSALLLLGSEEATVLLAVFKHLAEFSRKSAENVNLLKEKNVLQLLLDYEFYRENENILIQRFALYMTSTIIENTNTLIELETEKTVEIVGLSVRCYLNNDDVFCVEYLTVILNKCLDDPKIALALRNELEFLEKFYGIIVKTDDPDTLFHSLEAVQKMLSVLSPADVVAFSTTELFPIDRVLCDLNNDIGEIRMAALKVIKILIADTGESSVFAMNPRAVYTMDQLVMLFSRTDKMDTLPMVIEVLATALHTERMAQLFFAANLFNKMDRHIETNWVRPEFAEWKCNAMMIINEVAQWSPFLARLYEHHFATELLRCLMSKRGIPAAYVVSALNRFMKFPAAACEVVCALEEGLVEKLLGLMTDLEVPIKTREQCGQLVANLLLNGFHETANKLFELSVPTVLSEIFEQGLPQLSIDYVLALIDIVESLAQNEDYRIVLGQCSQLIKSIALLLKNSFSSAALVSSIFRCLCLLIDEETVRYELLANYLSASMKRGLQSLANVVKTAVTNFIMQSTRFLEFVHEYIDSGVLEVLILHQKHAFCVSTWGPAIDAILAKSPSLKFCIRNHLSFTDTTVGNDFLISKKKFDDFRVFQNILKAECSPLQPILVVNFDRPRPPPELVVQVPRECFVYDEPFVPEDDWWYCRRPGDEVLPVLLHTLNDELERQGLVENPTKVKRCIDFGNIAKRAKVVAEVVAQVMDTDLKVLDLNTPEECCQHTVRCHLKALTKQLHCNIIPLGMVHTGCQFERAVLFKGFADQIGLPCTLQRSVDGRILFNELPLPVEMEHDVHCDQDTMKFMSWRMLRPTHVIDLLYNVGGLYPMHSRQALQYLRLY